MEGREVMKFIQKANSNMLKHSFVFACIVSVFFLNCSLSDTTGSGQIASRSKVKIIHGASSTIELPSGNTNSDTIDVEFNSDSGVTYTVSLELPNTTWFVSNWDLVFSDSILWSRTNQSNTLLIPSEKSGLMSLSIYGPPKSKFEITVTENKTAAWWRPKPDNWDNIQTNTDSFGLARRLSFNENLGDSIVDRYWQIGSLTSLPWKSGQTVRSVYDSGSLRKNWYKFTPDSTREYTVLIQAIQFATPELSAFDSTGKSIDLISEKFDCGKYDICTKRAVVSVIKNHNIYFRISQYRSAGYRVMVSN
jgi:hypothetical protein